MTTTATELQKEFETCGIYIEHVFLLDCLTGQVEDHRYLNDELNSLNEDMASSLLGQEFAERLFNGDPDLAGYLRGIGGVLIKAQCTYPNFKEVGYATGGGKFVGRMTGTMQKTVYAWGKDVNSALSMLEGCGADLQGEKSE